MNNSWKPVYNYKGLYIISKNSKLIKLPETVKRKHYGVIHFPKRVMHPAHDQDGYLIVTLTKNKKHIMYKLHRLVLMSFKPIKHPEKYQVNHKNGIKDDDRLSNLEWCSCKHNLHYGSTPIKSAIKRSKAIKIKNIKSKKIYYFPSIKEASKWIYKTSTINTSKISTLQSEISDVLAKRQKSIHGYKCYWNKH